MEAKGISLEESVHNLSRDGKLTLGLVNRRRKRPLGANPKTICAVFDRSANGFGWLPRGWLVEKRRMRHSGRLYTYYYDPAGKMYSRRHKVVSACQNVGQNQLLVNLDDYSL